jgi:DNA helicase HerA-like ATPase
MRKFFVTLLVVDQRPSQISTDVMSQLGTRVSGWLGDEDDIHNILTGLPGREALRGMIARLEKKEEVLCMGWGVPVPTPVRTTLYNDEFWKKLLARPMGKAVIPVIQDEPLNPEAEGENEAEMVSTPLQDESAEDIMSNLGL